MLTVFLVFQPYTGFKSSQFRDDTFAPLRGFISQIQWIMPSNDPIQIWIWHKYQSISQYNVCFFIPQFLAQHNVYHLKTPIKIGRSPSAASSPGGSGLGVAFAFLSFSSGHGGTNLTNGIQWKVQNRPLFLDQKKHRQVMLVPGTNNEFFCVFFPYCPVVLWKMRHAWNKR